MHIKAERLRELVVEAQAGKVSDELVCVWEQIISTVWAMKWQGKLEREDAIQEGILALMMALPKMNPDGSLFAFSWQCVYWQLRVQWHRERRHRLPRFEEWQGD